MLSARMPLGAVASVKSPFAGVEIDGEGLALQRDIDDVGIAVVIDVAKVRAHARDERGILSESDVGLESNLFELVSEIVKEESVLGVIGDEEIGLAVEIVVRHPHAHAFADMIPNTPLFRNILECAVALVEKELVGQALVIARMAVLRNSLNDALGNIRIGPLQIVDDEQIEQSVVIHVDPDGGNRPQRAVLGIIPLVEAGFLRHIGEGAVAIVVIKRVAVNAGDEDVRMSIVVVVADGNADIESCPFQPGLFCHVRERAVAVVAEEAVEVLRRGFLQRCDVGAVGEEDIGAAIAVVVEDRDAAGHGFRDVFGGALTAVEAKGQLLELKADRSRGLRRGGRLLALQGLKECPEQRR